MTALTPRDIRASVRVLRGYVASDIGYVAQYVTAGNWPGVRHFGAMQRKHLGEIVVYKRKLARMGKP